MRVKIKLEEEQSLHGMQAYCLLQVCGFCLGVQFDSIDQEVCFHTNIMQVLLP